MKQSLAFALVVTLCLLTTACPKMEQSAYRTVVSANAFIHSLETAHPECATMTAPTALCVDLARANSAKNTLIDAIEVYCGGPSFDAGQACATPTGPAAQVATDKLKAAIGNMNNLVTDLRKSVGK